MDDFNVSTLHESKSEWASRLLTILTPLIIEGLKSIFEESYKLCKENGEESKYLMTFQNLISRIPKWSPNVIEQERKRIVEKSQCHYLEELITCIHIVQLKLLTAMRVGSKQKKIDINIPKLDDFIHKCYIAVARRIYKNVYLFELHIPPLQIQKNNREIEILVQECILNTIRESIPIDTILKAYMDETVEEDVVEEIKEEVMTPAEGAKESNHISEDSVPVISEEKESNRTQQTSKASSSSETGSSMNVGGGGGGIQFNDVDMTLDQNNQQQMVMAPKDIDRLEEISQIRNTQRKLESEADDDDDNNYDTAKDKIVISDQDIDLGNIVDIGGGNSDGLEEFNLDDIEILS